MRGERANHGCTRYSEKSIMSNLTLLKQLNKKKMENYNNDKGMLFRLFRAFFGFCGDFLRPRTFYYYDYLKLVHKINCMFVYTNYRYEYCKTTKNFE
jgi:hypothetical protein